MWADFYTPRAGMVFANLEREAKRIRYWDMLVKGQVRMIRRRQGGGYFTILTPPDGTSTTRRVAFRSLYVHSAIGYPGLKYLPDLQQFRVEQQDFHHVVSAYEDHEHVYNQLRTRPGTVLIRGGGIVASRVLARLMDDRAKYGLQTHIVHLFRTYISGSHGKNMWARRKGGNGFAYQGFNYPKSVWGGQLKARIRRLEGEERAEAYKEMGGTNTPWRRSWQRQMNEGRAAGWYQVVTGEVENMMVRPDAKVVSVVKTRTGVFEFPADFIIDCTGLEADIAEHRVLADLLEHGGAGRNPVGRLDVERTFEVRGTASRTRARCTPPAPRRWAATSPASTPSWACRSPRRRSATTLARHGFCKKIGPRRSTSQWLKWARNQADLTRAQELNRCFPPWSGGSRPGSSCSPSSAGWSR